MLNQKKILQSFGLFWVVFLLLHFLFLIDGFQNGLANIHANLFGNVAKRVMVDEVEFTQIRNTAEGDLYFAFYDKGLIAKAQKTGQTDIQVEEFYYANDPTYLINATLFFLLALCLATPLSWKKRTIITIVSILFFYVYSIIRMTYRIKGQVNGIGIGNTESNPNAIFSNQNIDQAMSTLGLVFIFIIVIWAMQVFSKSNMEEMKNRLLNVG